MEDLLDSEGYPTDSALELIEKWDYKDLSGLLLTLEYMWNFGDWGFKKKWSRDERTKQSVLLLELHTGGWSGNESIIYALEKNFFWTFCWVMSRRGGHYYFEIQPQQFGLKRVSDIVKEKNISRQAIYKSPHYQKTVIMKRLLFRESTKV